MYVCTAADRVGVPHLSRILHSSRGCANRGENTKLRPCFWFLSSNNEERLATFFWLHNRSAHSSICQHTTPCWASRQILGSPAGLSNDGHIQNARSPRRFSTVDGRFSSHQLQVFYARNKRCCTESVFFSPQPHLRRSKITAPLKPITRSVHGEPEMIVFFVAGTK